MMAIALPAMAGVYFEAPTAIPGAMEDRDAGPLIATDGSGTWIAQWSATSGLTGARSTDGGQTWSAPAPVDPSGEPVIVEGPLRSFGPSFVRSWSASPGGTPPADVYVSRSVDGGVTWSPRQSIFTIGQDASILMAGDAAGNWEVGYRLIGNAGTPYCELGIARSADDAMTFGPPSVVYSAPFNCPRAQLATDGAGTWLLAWSTGDTLGGTLGTERKILLMRSTDGGVTWSAPAPVSPPTGSADAPVAAAAGGARWILVWQVGDTLGGTLSPGYHLVSAESLDDGATWGPPAAMNPVAAVRPDGGSELPIQLIWDGDQTWIALTTFATILRSIDDGVTWSAPTPAHGSMVHSFKGVSTSIFPPGSMATDGLGTWVLGVGHRVDLSSPVNQGEVAIGTPLCTGPLAGCRVPVVAGKSKLILSDGTPNARDKMRWKWIRGSATDVADFGDPLTTTAYTWCLYDGAGRALAGTRIPAGGDCSGKPCWRAKSSGFFYKSKLREDSPFGAKKLVLKSGTDERAKIVLAAAHEGFSTPQLGGNALPLLAQLRTSDTGVCWETSYAAVQKETETRLLAK